MRNDRILFLLVILATLAIMALFIYLVPANGLPLDESADLLECLLDCNPPHPTPTPEPSAINLIHFGAK